MIKIKKKYATDIITEVLNSMVDEDRITEIEKNLLRKIISDIFYSEKIRINYYLDNYKEHFEELKRKDVSR